MEIRTDEFLVPEIPPEATADRFFAWCATNRLDPAAIAFMAMRGGSPDWIRDDVHHTINNMGKGEATEFLQRAMLRFDPECRAFYVGVNQR